MRLHPLPHPSLETSPLRRRRRLPDAPTLAPARAATAGALPAAQPAQRMGVLGMGLQQGPMVGSSSVDTGMGGWLLLPTIGGSLLGPLSTGGVELPRGIARRIPDDRLRQLLALADGRPDLAWKVGRSLALARNAHSTNTDEEIQNALVNEYDWLEGDVRRERDGTLVLAHDVGARDGLSLDEWLTIGARSGRGLKLDIKEADAIVPAIRRARQLGVPEGKIIINVTVKGERSEEMQLQQLRTIRRLYPGATVNLSVSVTSYDDRVVSTLAHWAEAAGGPIMFPLRHDLVTDSVIERLKPFGRIAIWNTPAISAPNNVDEEVQALRRRGVNGTIDLRTAGGWERLARPFVRGSLHVFGWGATVAMLRVSAFINWITA